MIWSFKATNQTPTSVRQISWWLLIIVTLGYVAAAWHRAHEQIIPECASGVELRLVVTVLGAARRESAYWSLDAQVISPESPRFSNPAPSVDFNNIRRCPSLIGKRLLLRWRTEQQLGVGQNLALSVKALVPWGASNPGGFDYRRWLLAGGYAGTGYVRRGHLLPIDQTIGLRERWIDALASKLESHGLVNAGTLLALVTGDGRAVDAATWERYRRTGAIHLLVVSGLHMSVLAVMLFFLISNPLRLFVSGGRRQLAELLSASAVCVGALGVVWFTGAGSPIVRVTGMLIGLLLLRWLQWRVSIWRVLLLALVISTWLMPLQVFRSGFWLSYGAVSVLLAFFSPRHPAAGPIGSTIQAQGVLCLGLSPLVVLVVNEASLLSMPANFLVVPIVTLITVPFLFLGIFFEVLQSVLQPESALFSALAFDLLRGADFSLTLSDVLLDALLQSVERRSTSFGYVSTITGILAMIAGLVLLLPLKTYARVGAGCMLLSVCLQTAQGARYGQFCIRVVDVGQGSAAIVDTARRRFLVDTGPGFESRHVGRSHVLPVLRSTGPHKLDLLLVSHLDMDHAGGVMFFREYFSPLPMIGPDSCAGDIKWQWDGVTFSILQASKLASDNDRSCTLLIENGSQSVFFSGDISALAEQVLLPQLPRDINLLIAPHHGSATSSSMPFVRKLSPEIVVFSTGNANRYGHPHWRVERRFEWEGARQLNTAETGAVQWCSDAPNKLVGQRRLQGD